MEVLSFAGTVESQSTVGVVIYLKVVTVQQRVRLLLFAATAQSVGHEAGGATPLATLPTKLIQMAKPGNIDGDVVVGNEVGNSIHRGGYQAFKSGAIYAAKNGGNEPILYGMLTDGNTATSRINADGSATFAGRITSNTATDYGFVDYSNSSTYGGYYSENKVATGPVYIGVNGVSGAKTTVE